MITYCVHTEEGNATERGCLRHLRLIVYNRASQDVCALESTFVQGPIRVLACSALVNASFPRVSSLFSFRTLLLVILTSNASSTDVNTGCIMSVVCYD